MTGRGQQQTQDWGLPILEMGTRESWLLCGVAAEPWEKRGTQGQRAEGTLTSHTCVGAIMHRVWTHRRQLVGQLVGNNWEAQGLTVLRNEMVHGIEGKVPVARMQRIKQSQGQ